MHNVASLVRRVHHSEAGGTVQHEEVILFGIDGAPLPGLHFHQGGAGDLVDVLAEHLTLRPQAIDIKPGWQDAFYKIEHATTVSGTHTQWQPCLQCTPVAAVRSFTVSITTQPASCPYDFVYRCSFSLGLYITFSLTLSRRRPRCHPVMCGGGAEPTAETTKCAVASGTAGCLGLSRA